jgi:hypothetical protein
MRVSALRERIVLWAERPYVMPDWVREHMPYTLQTTRLFDPTMLPPTVLDTLLPHCTREVPSLAGAELYGSKLIAALDRQFTECPSYKARWRVAACKGQPVSPPATGSTVPVI